MPKPYERNNAKMRVYKEVFPFCMDPNCKFGYALECHHIQPLRNGGDDTYANYIVLCFDCHRKRGIHSKWSRHQIRLLTYKFYQERLVVGRTSDEVAELTFHNALMIARQERFNDAKE